MLPAVAQTHENSKPKRPPYLKVVLYDLYSVPKLALGCLRCGRPSLRTRCRFSCFLFRERQRGYLLSQARKGELELLYSLAARLFSLREERNKDDAHSSRVWPAC